MNPLRSLPSLKLKLGIVIVAAVWITAVTTIVGVRAANLPSLVATLLGIALALSAVQLLARGTTKPLREMAAVASAMARGEHGREVAVTTNDEVGELARAFNRMTAELAETDRLRRDLVANVSHELRTPIGALQAVLENVVDGVSEPDPETLATMLAQTKRLGRLVTQLLDLSRLEAGDQPFDIRPFAVREVLESAAREARLHAPDDVVFSIDAPAELRAAGDAERIHQVVMNLVENAVRHSPRPGEIALRASSAGHTVTLEVDDEGPGIPADDLSRVFERFYRGDGRRGADGGGAGLGLAIARWIVELHGGTIRAERRDPHGSHMVVTLPEARVTSPSRVAVAPSPLAYAGRGMTVRAVATLAVAALAALTNAGCGEEREPGGRAAGTTPTPVAAGATTIANAVAVVDVSLSDYALAPANPRVARHGVVAFVATNDGQETHALAVDGPAGEVATRPLRPGEQEAIPVRLPPGTYKWLCPLDDHERRGMVGRVRVAE